MTAVALTEIRVSETLRAGSAYPISRDFIERQPLSEEERAVLWLRAWSGWPDELDCLKSAWDTDEPR